MPTVTGGLAEITIEQRIGTEPLSNVYYYWDVTNTPLVNLALIANDFDVVVAANMANVQAGAVSYEKIRVRDVFGLLPDHEKVPTVTAGLRTGSNMPTYVSVGFTLNGTTKETRVGAKRLGGQTETDIEGNAATAPYFAVLQAFATQLGLNLIAGPTFVPVIFGRVTPTRLVPVANPVTTASANTLVTTQNSRKVR